MDVAVFCLALMGTDYPAFLEEARRVLKPSGTLWIAEVRSRFSAGPGQARTLCLSCDHRVSLFVAGRCDFNSISAYLTVAEEAR